MTYCQNDARATHLFLLSEKRLGEDCIDVHARAKLKPARVRACSQSLLNPYGMLPRGNKGAPPLPIHIHT